MNGSAFIWMLTDKDFVDELFGKAWNEAVKPRTFIEWLKEMKNAQ